MPSPDRFLIPDTTDAMTDTRSGNLPNDGCYEIVPSGTSDDTGIIQDALDQLQAGDTLKLKGDFFIRDTIYLPSNFKWVLDGTLIPGR